VKSFIERFVILGKSVVKLNELREIYVSKSAETEFSNPNYRSENLKAEIISARWMVLCFTGKRVNTSYSSEQMIVMLFLCNSLDNRRSLDPDKIIFRPDCIYCEKEGRKKIKVKGSWKTERTVRFEYDGFA
jgi:hypothetical protein